MNSQRERIVALAARHGVPAIYNWRESVAAGGLVSSRPALPMHTAKPALYRANPQGREAGELPVLQPTRFELVINLKTAKTLGLDVPDKLLARADEVIE